MENYGDRKRKGEVREERSGNQSPHRESSPWEKAAIEPQSIKIFGKILKVSQTDISTEARSSIPVEVCEKRENLQKIKKISQDIDNGFVSSIRNRVDNHLGELFSRIHSYKSHGFQQNYEDYVLQQWEEAKKNYSDDSYNRSAKGYCDRYGLSAAWGFVKKNEIV